MNAATGMPNEIADLIFRLSEGALNSDELNALADWLAASAKNRSAYVELLELFASLEWERGGSGKHLVLDQRIYESAGNSASDNQVSLPHAVATVSAETKPSLPVLRLVLRSFSRPVFRYAALVALGLYGSFALIAWNLRPDRAPNRPPHNSEAVAAVRDTADVQWEQGVSSKSVESSVFVGEPLKITSGTIELELKTGTRLVIEGPADWTVDGDNSVSLRAGKLAARVPQQAIGFSVETPTARVVDLGTEFTIVTDRQGSTEVQVLVGKVELRTGARRDDDSSTTEIIEAGTARRVEADGKNNGVVVRKIAPKADHFIRSSSLSPARPIRVEAAIASSTHPALNVNDLINGQGLKGDRHSADWQHTMWHSNWELKNVLVQFDLFRLHRLQSMSVWNLNDDRYAWAGVKQADIYASSSGKGDPLSEPDEWKLVVADQKFAPGTGRDDYATPTVVSLGDVEARFVAIVIEEALGHDPREKPQPGMVGLSEVQFSGSRVAPPKPQTNQQEK